MDTIQVENVSKSFVNHRALDNVTMSVPQGSIFGMLGPNGAGKTTLIRIVNQIYAPDSGQIRLFGEPARAAHVERIGYLPEERGLYKKMKVGDQAIYLSQLKGLSRRDALRRLKHWFEKFEIQAWWDKKVEELSKGMAQKIQFVTTVIHEPELLIFDEPFSGFDPINANLLKEEMLELRRKGATIIFSTHNMSSVEELCDHVALINRSRKVLDGPVADIREAYRSNTYRLEYDGDLAAFAAQNARYQTAPADTKGRHQAATITVGKDDTPNQLLAELLRHVEVHAFSEVLPSMNDIFIKVVNENIQQTENAASHE